MTDLAHWQPATRRERLLTLGIDAASQKGLEIGALHSPIIRPQYGDVRFIDYTDTATLRSRHKDYPERLAGMVDVSYVWQGMGSLAQIIDTGELFDWAIASHAVEHVPNMLGWFRGIAEVLRPGGIFNLAIPDRRFTFDVRCPESTFGELVEADLLGFTRPSIRQMFDHCYYARAIEPGQIWQDDIDVGKLDRYSGPIAPQLAYDQALEILRDGRYFDSHCWIVTPLSFLDLLYGASAQNLFPFIPMSIVPTGQGEFEFFISLRNTDPAMKPATRREEQLSAIRRLRVEVEAQQRTARLLAE